MKHQPVDSHCPNFRVRAGNVNLELDYDFFFFIYCYISEICVEKVELNHKRNIKKLNTASSSQSDTECPSDGEKMTAELRDIIRQFMQKVSWKICQILFFYQ